MKVDGLKLRREIARREMTVDDFAKEAGVSSPAVFRALNNSKANTRTLGKLANALGYDDPLDLLQPADRAEATL
ncbi:MAG: helix-turn-helix domain-containing protein [Selenomonadaceae bacterium]|nr:helix-turn-helix domain-containing protein [Selenomonadaceae bacterium]